MAATATVDAPPKALSLPAAPLGDPALEKQRLLVTAREGLPVAGVPATSWEALRPKIVEQGSANKVGRAGAVGVGCSAAAGWAPRTPPRPSAAGRRLAAVVPWRPASPSAAAPCTPPLPGARLH